MVLSIPGVDYESLDRSEQEYAVKRLEAALKAFGAGFHVYQYLFKSNRPDIPFAKYDDPIVEAAQPAYRRRSPHRYSRDQPEWQVVFLQFLAPKRAEVRAPDLHLRYRRQLPIAYDHL